MNKERLKKIIVVLKSIKDSQFKFSVFFKNDYGCAIGWFCKKTQEMELKESFRGLWYPVYEGDTHYTAVATYLECKEAEVYKLFCPEFYPNKQQTERSEVIEKLEAAL